MLISLAKIADGAGEEHGTFSSTKDRSVMQTERSKW
jgi:hypothetical protein